MSARQKILAVDDSDVNLEVLSEILSESYSLCTATSGEEALEVMEREQPDLVLLDIMMPGIDGYEVCRRIRSSPQLNHTMIILVSAKAFVAERLAGYEAGADDYLTKPFNEYELLAKVKVFLRLKSVEEIDAMKSNLLSFVSNEIQTPNTGIIPAGERLCAAGGMSCEERQMWAEVALENARRLLDLSQRGILLCRLQDGMVTLDVEPVDIAGKIRRIIEITSVAVPPTIEFHEEEGSPFVIEADEELLDAGIRSLFEGAARASQSDSVIDVRLCSTAETVKIEALLHHTTTRPDDEKLLLQPVGTSRTGGEFAGSDMGLPFARAVFRAHGGGMSVQRLDDQRLALTAELPVRATADSSPIDMRIPRS